MLKIRLDILLACSNFFCSDCFKFLGQHFSKEKVTIFKKFEIFAEFYDFLVLRILLKFTKSFMREYKRGRQMPINHGGMFSTRTMEVKPALEGEKHAHANVGESRSQ